MDRKRPSTDEEVMVDIEKWRKGLIGNNFEEATEELIPRFSACIARNGDYVEK